MRLLVPSVRARRGAFPFSTLTQTPPPSPEPEWTTPITINEGGVYEGAWDSPDTTPAVTITTTAAVTIRGHVRGYGTLVSAPATPSGQQVTLEDLEMTSLGHGRAFVGDVIASLTIQRCDLIDTRGIYIHQSSNASISILNNRARNIGAFGTNAAPLNQFVQFDKTRDVTGSIAWNEVINTPYESRPEDVINFFDSGGSTSQQYVIERNFIRGAYPDEPLTDGFSGGGIIVGDYDHGYTTVRYNTVLDTLNYGIAIAGGRNNLLQNNTVIGLNKIGASFAASANIGMYIWHQVGSVDPGNNSGSDNSIAWFNSSGARNDSWMPDATSWTGQVALADPTEAALTAAHDDWLVAARAQGWPF